jgi:hypothetical protein
VQAPAGGGQRKPKKKKKEEPGTIATDPAAVTKERHHDLRVKAK